MKTELKVRQQAIALHLQGWNKSEIARKVQRSRRWVQRWIRHDEPEPPVKSLQDHLRAPKHNRWAYPERIKRMAIQIRIERERGKRAKYQYALVSAQAIYYEMRELGISPLPTPDTIHLGSSRQGGSGNVYLGKHPIPRTRFCLVKR